MDGLVIMTCMTVTVQIVLAFDEQIGAYFGLLQAEPRSEKL